MAADLEVTCRDCQKSFPIRDQVEPSASGTWSCGCKIPDDYGPDRLNIVKEVVARWRTQHENKGETVLRELVQNADDAEAQVLVLRFERDALYVVNDGHSFRTGGNKGEPDDFARIGRWFGRHKSAEKASTGNFGSGFLTVFLLTNLPEIHSNGRSVQLDPVAGKMVPIPIGSGSRLASPYSWHEGSDHKGVVFRLPWRDSAAAQAEFPGFGRPFSDANDFPVWDEKERCKLFQDLVAYASEVILCCRNLQTLRLLWVAEGKAQAVQAKRDFTLESPQAVKPIGTVKVGPLDVLQKYFEWPPDQRDQSNLSKNWSAFQREFKWKRIAEERRYWIATDVVRDKNGQPCFVGQDAQRSDGGRIITTDLTQLKGAQDEKPNDIYLLFPLRNITRSGQRIEPALLYSTIPLPRRSLNWFVFTGGFFPAESRTDVAIQDVPGEWYRAIVLSVGRLYHKRISEFISYVRQDPDLDEPEKQSVILNALPTCHLSRWMRPDEPEGSWAEDINEHIVRDLIGTPSLWWNGEWKRPNAATWVDLDGSSSEDGRIALAALDVPTFSASFIESASFKGTLAKPLQARKLTCERFHQAFDEFLGREGPALYYNQPARGKASFSRQQIEALVRFCLVRRDRWPDLADLPIMPAKDGQLHRVRDFPVLPPGFEEILEILPESRIVHADFATALASAGDSRKVLTPDELVQLVASIVGDRWNPGASVPECDHKVLSSVLIKLVRRQGFVLKQEHEGLRFIPVSYLGRIVVVPPNATKNAEGIPEVFLKTRAETYKRDFVFAPEPDKHEWLTEELRRAIRFLDLAGASEEDFGPVCDVLHLFGLQERGLPTNFIRHFVAPNLTSLFEDKELARFLRIEDSDSDTLDRQKKAMIQALPIYFAGGPKTETASRIRPEDMGNVPCLFDSHGKWYPARSFTLEKSLASELMGCKVLHQTLQKWPQDVLRALGVPPRPDAKAFISKVGEYLKGPSDNRGNLSNLAAYALITEHSWGGELGPLAQQAWIPTLAGKLVSPAQALLNTRENRDVVGSDYPQLFDLAITEPKILAELGKVPPPQIEERAREVGIRLRPTFNDMLSVLGNRAKAGTAPPPRLFEALNQAVEQAPPSNHKISGGMYYLSNAWIPGTRIILSDDTRLKEAFEDTATVLPSAISLSLRHFLGAIGARTDPTPSQFIAELRAVAQKLKAELPVRRDRLQNVWTLFEESIPKGSLIPLEDNGDLNTLPFSAVGQVTQVSKVIIPSPAGDSGPFARSGWWGSYYVIPPGDPSQPVRVLGRLGAKLPSDVCPDDVEAILQDLGSRNSDLTEPEAKTATALLASVATKDCCVRFRKTDIWPIRRGTIIRIGKASEAYVLDMPKEEELQQSFQQSGLPVLVGAQDTEEGWALRNLALAQAAPPRLLSKSIRWNFVSAKNKQPEENGTQRFKLMAEALTCLSSKGVFPSGDFAWLKKAQAFTVTAIGIKVEVAGSAVTVPRNPSCYIWEEPDGPAIVYLCIEQPRLMDDLIALFLDRTGGRAGMAPEGRSSGVNSQRLLRDLLTAPPDHWHQLYPDLPEFERYLPPLVSPDIEYKPGYLDTRDKLLSQYGACQICGRKTPVSANPSLSDTCEMITSVISLRGGNYKGTFERYELANALFLCPSHQVLYRRGLVRFLAVESVAPSGRTLQVEEARKAAEALRRLAGQRGGKLAVEVYEVSEQTNPEAKTEPAWKERILYLTDEHGSALLARLADWVERASR